MADRKAPGPVEQSIARLRELRYKTRGAGAKSNAIAAHARSVDQLREAIAEVRTQKKAAKKKAKRR